MKKQKNKWILTVISGATYLFIALQSASAMSSNSLLLNLENGEEMIMAEMNATEKKEFIITAHNTSEKEKKLKIYAIDGYFENKNFVGKNKTDLSNDLTPWINLSSSSLNIPAGKSANIKATIVVPQNAGVGIHSGAIIFSEKINNITVENGIRAHIKIAGVAEKKYEFQNLTITPDEKFINVTGKIINKGNTDLKGEMIFQIKSKFNKKAQKISEKIFIKPGAVKKMKLTIPKPSNGLYSANIFENLSGNYNSQIQTNINVLAPDLSAIVIAIGLITFILIISLGKKPKKLIGNIFIMSTIIAILSLLTIEIKNQNISNLLKANLLNQDFSPKHNHYYLKIEHGNIENLFLPLYYKTHFKGEFEILNASVEMARTINLENDDKIELKDNILLFDVKSSNKTNGVELLIKADNENKYPIIRMKNLSNERIFSIDMLQLLQNKKFQTGEYGIKLSANNLPIIIEEPETIEMINEAQEKIPRPQKESESISNENQDLSDTILDETQVASDETNENQDLSDTILDETQVASDETNENHIEEDELSNKNTLSKTEIDENIAVIKELIKELSENNETDINYSIESNAIIEKYNEMATIMADSQLIESLGESPENIKNEEKINIMFVPKEKIRFVPQNFSFERNASSSQEIGQIMFFQNKKTPWNTYMMVTEFVSEDKRHRIPLENITIIPGNTIISERSNDFSETEIFASEETTLSASNNQGLLVSVFPKDDSEIIFTLNPRIKVNIPPGTPPGIYRAEISFRTL